MIDRAAASELAFQRLSTLFERAMTAGDHKNAMKCIAELAKLIRLDLATRQEWEEAIENLQPDQAEALKPIWPQFINTLDLDNSEE